MENIFDIVFRILGFVLFFILVSFFSFAKKRKRMGDEEGDNKKKQRLSSMGLELSSYDDALSDVLKPSNLKATKASRFQSMLEDRHENSPNIRHEDSFLSSAPLPGRPSFQVDKTREQSYTVTSPLRELRQGSRPPAGGSAEDVIPEVNPYRLIRPAKKSRLSKSMPAKKKSRISAYDRQGSRSLNRSRSAYFVASLRSKPYLKRAIIVNELLSRPLALREKPNTKA